MIYGVSDRRRMLEVMDSLILLLSDDAMGEIFKILFNEVECIESEVQV